MPAADRIRAWVLRRQPDAGDVPIYARGAAGDGVWDLQFRVLRGVGDDDRAGGRIEIDPGTGWGDRSVGVHRVGMRILHDAGAIFAGGGGAGANGGSVDLIIARH